MLTYELKKSPGVPLYEALYRCIRQDILEGILRPGQKLPSKRALAQNLEVSKITVEGAYQQLLAEGYISAREKVGYFVEKVERLCPPEIPKTETKQPEKTALTAQQARDIALADAGMTTATFERTEYDTDDGVPEYEIEFHAEGWEYNYEIQAETGKILSSEKDRDD